MASITCSNCQTESAEGTAVCPGCGAALVAPAAAPSAVAPPPVAPAPAPAAAAPAPAAAAPPADAATSQVKFDATKLSQTDRIVGIASFVLLISLFLSWFSVSLGSIGSVSASGLSAHGYLYLVLILSIVIVGLLAIRALGIWEFPSSAPMSEEQALLIACAVNFVLVLIAFLLKPGGVGSGVGWSFGAFIGLIASIVALVPLARPALAARSSK
jgi:hypothetical protein